MTRSSIVAALVVTVLLGLLIWWRDEHGAVERKTEALSPRSAAFARPAGEAVAVPSARPVSPPAAPMVVPPVTAPRSNQPASSAGSEIVVTIPFEGVPDASASGPR